jgi:hypothetical protein
VEQRKRFLQTDIFIGLALLFDIVQFSLFPDPQTMSPTGSSRCNTKKTHTVDNSLLPDPGAQLHPQTDPLMRIRS